MDCKGRCGQPAPAGLPYRNVSYKGNERQESYLSLDSDEITRYYNIFIQVGLTGMESGQEEDCMSLDLVAEIASLDDLSLISCRMVFFLSG